MTHPFDFKGETNSPQHSADYGGLARIPIRRRTHTLLKSVRRVGELQERFDFGKQRVKRAAAERTAWPEIVLAGSYPDFLRRLALMALHRSGKVHASECCPRCQQGNAAMSEQYKLRCFVCHCEVEIPTTVRSCVRCGTTFEIDWESEDQFRADFRKLTSSDSTSGYDPLLWQVRLFELFRANNVPKICDLPTGMGKTSVIHIWLLALREQITTASAKLPTRLIYVVDRRTVVDQATEIASQARKNCGLLGLPENWFTVSTLRGQLADDREWTADPARRAIIVGTVDMIGSRLLFSGYRSSFKRRPLDAGMLGQDSFLILDEAHLSAPFEKLIRAIGSEGPFQSGQGMPMRVLCMSATANSTDPGRFKLEASDLDGDCSANPILKRYDATKSLQIQLVAEGKIQTGILEATINLATGGSRIVVFVRQPDEADEIRKSIFKRNPALAVEVLTGTMRGLERDRLLETPVLKRFLDGEEKPEDQAGKQPAILICTSAGEVGFDLNADHMVCDAAPLDSMIQRLGRVNRRGHGKAFVRMLAEEKQEEKAGGDKSKARKHTFESAVAATLLHLKSLHKQDGSNGEGPMTYNVSPRSMDCLRQSLSTAQFDASMAPKPEIPELTDILLDAWSMTTIYERMPGRPQVAPWLRGVTSDEPQTTIAWRAELDIDGFESLEVDQIEEWFDAHRLLPHETLTVPVSKAAQWVLDRWENLGPELQETLGKRACTIEDAGLTKITFKELIEKVRSDSKRKKLSILSNAYAIFPAAFGGISRSGMLDSAEPKTDHPDDNAALAHVDVGDEKTGRFRLLQVGGEGAAESTGLVTEPPTNTSDLSRFSIEIPSSEAERKLLISLVRKRQRAEFGSRRQSLAEHVGLVEFHAANIIRRLGGLEQSSDVACALALAASWHDNGKNREHWQRAAGRKEGEEPVGKSGGSMGRLSGGYRHEFGSLCEFQNEFKGKVVDDVFDLAMHLIAAHHGRARPHFFKGGFDPCSRSTSPEIAIHAVRRFGRLQRKYGRWRLAYLENLLRCADAMASTESN
jgi:CRISPR-associated endonuclease/helicase Cas3